VRIIDFGLVIKMTGEILTSHKLSGTRGYHAPETLRWKQYSPKTDIWQAGVCLYSMLSGFLPFHPDNDAQSLEAKYFPMIGPAWLGISDRAKDLVSHILVADPDKRFSISEILKHPWMTSEASQEDLGVEYVARLKHLALRQKMRGFFLQNDIGETNKLRRGHLAELLPFLKPSARTRLASYVSVNPAASATSAVKVGRINSSSSLSYGGSEHGLSCSYSSSSSHGPSSPCKSSLQERAVVEFKTKLHVFQELVIESFREKLQRVNGHNHSPDPSSSKFAYTVGGSDSPSSEQQRQGQGDRDLCLGYEEFVDLLSKAGLSHLAERTVFSIFDITNSGQPHSLSLSIFMSLFHSPHLSHSLASLFRCEGVIDLKEFLFTMVAFQPEDPEELNSLSCSVDLEDSSDVTLLQTIRMFFHFFDLHGSGSIQLDDFKLAVSCLLSSNSNANGNGGHHLQPAATLSLYSYPSQDFSDLFFSSSPPSSHGSSFFNSHSHNQSQQSHASVENIEELFLAIDTDRNGKIGFAEFRDFYLALLATTSQNGAAGQLS
jgi:serine/threonine protein kinase